MDTTMIAAGRTVEHLQRGMVEITLHGMRDGMPDGWSGVQFSFADGQRLRLIMLKRKTHLRWRYPDGSKQNDLSLDGSVAAFIDALTGAMSCALDDGGDSRYHTIDAVVAAVCAEAVATPGLLETFVDREFSWEWSDDCDEWLYEQLYPRVAGSLQLREQILLSPKGREWEDRAFTPLHWMTRGLMGFAFNWLIPAVQQMLHAEAEREAASSMHSTYRYLKLSPEEETWGEEHEISYLHSAWSISDESDTDDGVEFTARLTAHSLIRLYFPANIAMTTVSVTILQLNDDEISDKAEYRFQTERTDALTMLLHDPAH